MASRKEDESIVDMFARLGRELRLPDVEVEEIIELNRRNLEAFERSARTASGGAASLMARQAEMLQETLRDINAMAERYRSPGDPGELMKKQAEFVRKSFETAVKNTGEMAEMARKSNEESLEILRKRIRESMREIGDAYDRRS